MIHRSLALIKRLPLGPIAAPFIGNFLWLRKSFSELESIIPDLHAKYGLIITLWIGSHPTIFISIKSFIHQALVQNSAVFVNRLPLPLTHKVISCNQQNITAKFYGLNWRLFRQQLHLAPNCDSSRPNSVAENDGFKRLSAYGFLMRTAHGGGCQQIKKSNYFSFARLSFVFWKDSKGLELDNVSGSLVKRMSSSTGQVIRKYSKKVKPLYKKPSQKKQCQ